jgi:hypothetical protein
VSTLDWTRICGLVRLRKVRINQGGYDDGGAYWGTGETLWHAETDEAEGFFRAPSRLHAKQYVRDNAGDAVRFYR